MVVKRIDAIQRKAQDFFSFGICTTYQEKLPLFDHMCKVIIGGIAPVSQINGRGVVLRMVNHLAESAVFVPFTGRLDHKVSKFFIQDGKESIDMDLVEAAWGLPIWPEESIRIVGVPENIDCGPITGDQGISAFIEMFFTFEVKRNEQAA